MGQFGLVLKLGSVTDTIIASPRRHIEISGVTGEASLAVIRRDGKGNVLWWTAADAFALAVDGRTVASRTGTATTLAEAT